MSTLVVLASYWIFTKRKDSASPFLINTALVIVGVISLFFRQTNIFWVAVFPAALAVVDALKEGQKPGQNDAETAIDESWNHGRLYDCPVETAGPQGAFRYKQVLLTSEN
jgi:alpha-1,2-glucosyltransferase